MTLNDTVRFDDADPTVKRAFARPPGKVKLTESVWGFTGQASGQREFKDERVELQHVFLIGGGWQVWIPNLTPRHLMMLSVLP